jgi:hypothetical protein
MKIIPIFVSETDEQGIWSVRFDLESESEFDRFFNLINDPEWLYQFFEANRDDLKSGFWKQKKVEDAILQTLDEVYYMEELLCEFAEKGFANYSLRLQDLFKPLNNYEYALTTHQKSKARVRNGWLRLYGIRLTANCYLISGGGIKLTREMHRPHLQNELRKLEQAKTYLKSNGIEYPEDLNSFNDE